MCSLLYCTNYITNKAYAKWIKDAISKVALQKEASVSSEPEIIFVNDLETKMKSLTIMLSTHFIKTVNSYEGEIKQVSQLKQPVFNTEEIRQSPVTRLEIAVETLLKGSLTPRWCCRRKRL